MSKKIKSDNAPATHREYTVGEEIANSISHGIGAALSIAGLVLLVYFASKRGNVWQVVSFSIYGTTLIMLYMSSTLYHSFRKSGVKKILKIIDHSSIYLLIAGTYTPFLLVSIRGTVAWILFGVIWALAIAGIIFKILFINRFKKLSVILYIMMGWLSIIVIGKLIAVIPAAGMVWLAAGGFSYTFGVLFYVWKSLPYTHLVWHLFVLGGSICHFISIIIYVLPVRP